MLEPPEIILQSRTDSYAFCYLCAVFYAFHSIARISVFIFQETIGSSFRCVGDTCFSTSLV